VSTVEIDIGADAEDILGTCHQLFVPRRFDERFFDSVYLLLGSQIRDIGFVRADADDRSCVKDLVSSISRTALARKLRYGDTDRRSDATYAHIADAGL
jgi:hypothetical protein